MTPFFIYKWNLSRAYSTKWGHACDFLEKEQEIVKKGQNLWKFGKNSTKFKNSYKKGRWLRAIIAHNKLLE